MLLDKIWLTLMTGTKTLVYSPYKYIPILRIKCKIKLRIKHRAKNKIKASNRYLLIHFKKDL